MRCGSLSAARDRLHIDGAAKEGNSKKRNRRGDGDAPMCVIRHTFFLFFSSTSHTLSRNYRSAAYVGFVCRSSFLPCDCLLSPSLSLSLSATFMHVTDIQNFTMKSKFATRNSSKILDERKSCSVCCSSSSIHLSLHGAALDSDSTRSFFFSSKAHTHKHLVQFVCQGVQLHTHAHKHTLERRRGSNNWWQAASRCSPSPLLRGSNQKITESLF